MPQIMDTVEVQVEAQLKKQVTEILERQGLTLNEAFQRMLTHVAEEGSLQFADDSHVDMYGDTDPEYDAWFRAKVQEALDEPGPGIPYQNVEAHFSRRREAALRKANG